MLIRGDARYLPLVDGCVQTCITSPPYWAVRKYAAPPVEWRDGWIGELGQEPSPDLFVAHLVDIFREVWRVLKADGVLWLNMGDCYSNGNKGGYAKSRVTAEDSLQGHHLDSNFAYAPNRLPQAGLKNKDLVGVPYRLALALQADGWYWRSAITWAKAISFCDTYVGSCMPENIPDRPTNASEQLFLFAKQERYFYDKEAVKERGVYPAGTRAAKGSGEREGNRRRPLKQDGLGRRYKGFNARWDDYAEYDGFRNLRNVWAIPVEPSIDEHQAHMPEGLVMPCILAGSRPGDVVLDPFVGSGTVVRVAQQLGRRGVGVDLSYQDLARTRTAQRGLMFGSAGA